YSASGLPAGASFDAATKTFSWTPGYDQAGSYPGVTFTVTDGTAPVSETITITISNTNRVPVLAPIGTKTGAEGSLLTFTLSATDADGDALTYSASGLPAGASFDAATKTFSWTPGYDQAGSYPGVTFTETDGTAPVSETISITINNTNRAPVASDQAIATDGTPKAIVLIVTDVDGDPLTYAIVTAPAHGTLSGTAPNLTYTPAPA